MEKEKPQQILVLLMKGMVIAWNPHLTAVRKRIRSPSTCSGEELNQYSHMTGLSLVVDSVGKINKMARYIYSPCHPNEELDFQKETIAIHEIPSNGKDTTWSTILTLYDTMAKQQRVVQARACSRRGQGMRK